MNGGETFPPDTLQTPLSPQEHLDRLLEEGVPASLNATHESVVTLRRMTVDQGIEDEVKAQELMLQAAELLEASYRAGVLALTDEINAAISRSDVVAYRGGQVVRSVQAEYGTDGRAKLVYITE